MGIGTQRRFATQRNAEVAEALQSEEKGAEALRSREGAKARRDRVGRHENSNV